jgi:hypothetical protein
MLQSPPINICHITKVQEANHFLFDTFPKREESRNFFSHSPLPHAPRATLITGFLSL